MKAIKKIGAGILVATMAMSMCACDTGSKSSKKDKNDKHSKKITSEVDDEDEDDDDDDKKSDKKSDKDDKKSDKDDKKSDKDDKKSDKEDKDDKDDKKSDDDEIIETKKNEDLDDLTTDKILDPIYEFDMEVSKYTYEPTDTVSIEISTSMTEKVSFEADLILSDVNFDETVIDTLTIDSTKTVKYEFDASVLGDDEFEEGFYALELRNVKDGTAIFAFFDVGDGGNMVIVDGSADGDDDIDLIGEDPDEDPVISNVGESDDLRLPDEEVRGYVEDGVYYNEYFGFSIDFNKYGEDVDIIDCTVMPDSFVGQFYYELTGMNGTSSEFVVMITELDHDDIDAEAGLSIIDGTTDHTSTFSGVEFRVNEDDTYYAVAKGNTIMFIGFISSGVDTMQTLKAI